MRVTVHYMAQIKRHAGCSSEVVEVAPSVSVHELLGVLAQRHGPDFKTLLMDDAGGPRRSLLFFVGDEHADLSRTLMEGDAVTILAPMSGGQ
jgi:molybdopterin converting factor small subunit